MPWMVSGQPADRTKFFPARPEGCVRRSPPLPLLGIGGRRNGFARPDLHGHQAGVGGLLLGCLHFLAEPGRNECSTYGKPTANKSSRSSLWLTWTRCSP